jgi:hypothetical protein
VALRIDMARVRELLATGIGMNATAKAVGCSYWTLRLRMRELGIKPVWCKQRRGTKRTVCFSGRHDITKPGSRVGGQCRKCVHEVYAMHRAEIRKPTAEKLHRSSIQEAQDRMSTTRAILYCDTMKDRASTWWDREHWEQQKSQLLEQRRAQ